MRLNLWLGGCWMQQYLFDVDIEYIYDFLFECSSIPAACCSFRLSHSVYPIFILQCPFRYEYVVQNSVCLIYYWFMKERICAHISTCVIAKRSINLLHLLYCRFMCHRNHAPVAGEQQDNLFSDYTLRREYVVICFKAASRLPEFQNGMAGIYPRGQVADWCHD